MLRHRATTTMMMTMTRLSDPRGGVLVFVR